MCVCFEGLHKEIHASSCDCASSNCASIHTELVCKVTLVSRRPGSTWKVQQEMGLNSCIKNSRQSRACKGEHEGEFGR